MNENIKNFLAKVERDQELQAKFAQLRDPDKAYSLASSVQEGFTKEEFVTEMKQLYEERTKDLSEEDMAKVAGGLDREELMNMTVTSGGFYTNNNPYVSAAATAT